jgi:septum formation protein
MDRDILILASASPRRQALLAAAGVAFETIESGVDELREPGEATADFAERMACAKALAVSTRYPTRLVLGADTMVECDGEILGKPRDVADARRMLAALSGNTHTVVTAFAIARTGTILESALETSRVTFRELGSREIDDYIASGEPLDKAGAYGIQSAGGGFIVAVEGGRDNVMGLPVRAVIAALARWRE